MCSQLISLTFICNTTLYTLLRENISEYFKVNFTLFCYLVAEADIDYNAPSGHTTLVHLYPTQFEITKLVT